MKHVRYQSIAGQKEIKDYLEPNFWQEIKDYIFYFLKTFVIIALIFVFARTSVVDLIGIEGESMWPNYNSSGTKEMDKIYINKLTPKFSGYKRGQVVVLIAPSGCRLNKTLYIKRIIGLPKETIRLFKGNVYIINEQYPYPGIQLDESNYLKPTVKSYKQAGKVEDNEVLERTLSPNEYYFMGDNRSGSQDARACGPILKDQILGEEVYRLTPASKRSIYTLPKYNIGNQ
jgi:signal peptidase I